MKCINYNSSEYKSLLADSGLNNLQLDAAIVKYQKDNNTDRFPSIGELLDISQNRSSDIAKIRKLIASSGMSVSITKALNILSRYRSEFLDPFGYPDLDTFKMMVSRWGKFSPIRKFKGIELYDKLPKSQIVGDLRDRLSAYVYFRESNAGIQSPQLQLKENVVDHISLIIPNSVVDSLQKFLYPILPADGRNIDTIANRGKGLQIVSDNKLNLTYKRLEDGDYIFYDIKENIADEDGIVLPTIVYRGYTKVNDVVYEHQVESGIFDDNETTRDAHREREIKKMLKSIHNASTSRSANAKVQLYLSELKKLSDRNGGILSRKDLKNMTPEQAHEFTAENGPLYTEARKQIKRLMRQVEKMSPQELRENMIQMIRDNNTEIAHISFCGQISEEPDRKAIKLTEHQIQQLSHILQTLPDGMVKLLNFDFISGLSNAWLKLDTRKNQAALMTSFGNIYRSRRAYPSYALVFKTMIQQGRITEESYRNIESYFILPALAFDYDNAPIESVLRQGNNRSPLFSVSSYLNALVKRDFNRIVFNNADIPYIERFRIFFDKLINSNSADITRLLSGFNDNFVKRQIGEDIKSKFNEYLSPSAIDVLNTINSIIDNIGVLQSNVTLSSDSISLNEEDLKKNKDFKFDPASVGLHEFGHQFDLYLTTIDNDTRKKILQVISRTIREVPQFKEYLTKGFLSRGYKFDNAKEFTADIFGVVLGREAGIDMSEGHLASLDSFFKDHAHRIDNIAKDVFGHKNSMTFFEILKYHFNKFLMWIKREFGMNLSEGIGQMMEILDNDSQYSRSFENFADSVDINGQYNEYFIPLLKGIIFNPDNFNVDNILKSNTQSEFLRRDDFDKEGKYLHPTEDNQIFFRTIVSQIGESVSDGLKTAYGDSVESGMATMDSNGVLQAMLEKNPNISTESRTAIGLAQRASAKRGINVPVRFFDGSRDPEAADVEFLANVDEGWGGFYSASDNLIGLNRNNLTDETIMHEVFHPLTIALANDPNLRPEFQKIFDEVVRRIQKKYNKTVGELLATDHDTFYGASSLNEFIPELFTNSKFIEVLKNIETFEKGNLLQRIWDAILRLFGKAGGNTKFDYISTRDYFANLIENYANDNKIPTTGNEVLFKMMPNEFSNDSAYIKNVLDEFSNTISFVDAGHKYFDKGTTNERVSVSTIKQLAGYGDHFDESVSGHRSELSMNFGTGIHSHIEKIIRDMFGLPARQQGGTNFSPITGDALKKLRGIVMDLLPHGTEILGVEVVVGEDTLPSAGTIDLLIKAKNGEIWVVDMKTKIVTRPGLDRGDYNPWSDFNHVWEWTYDKDGNKVPLAPSARSKSQAQQYTFQQVAYKTMLELKGVKVDRIGIVPLELHLEESPDKDAQSAMYGGYRIKDINISLKQPTNDDSNGYGFRELSTPRSLVNDVYAQFNVTRPTNTSFSQKRLDNTARLAEEGIKRLTKRAAKLRTMRRVTDAEALRVRIDDAVDNSGFDARTILGVIRMSASELAKEHDRYNRYLELSRTEGVNKWSFRTLEHWEDLAKSLDILDEIQTFLTENPDMFKDIPGLSIGQIDTMLRTAIEHKNALAQAMYTKGIDKWLDWITKFSDVVEATYRRNAELEFRRNFAQEGRKWTKETDNQLKEFVENRMNSSEIQAKIKFESREFLEKQSKFATQDIGSLRRYLSSIFDTSDPIIGAMTAAYHDSIMGARETFTNVQKQMVVLLREFEKKYKPGSFTDNRELYEYMLDTTGDQIALVNRFSQKFMQDRRAFEDEIDMDHTIEPEEKRARKRAWLKENAPIPKQSWDGIHREMVAEFKRLESGGQLNHEQVTALINNENDRHFKSYWILADNYLIDTSIIDAIRTKKSRLMEEARVPNATKYPNAKYESMMKLDKSSIEYRLWDFLLNLADDINDRSQFRYRIGYRLPGMMKSLAERVVAGENIWSVASGELKRTITGINPNDTEFGTAASEVYGAGTERNEAVEFVPVHFTGKIPESEQSFDLPTIYMEWAKSALNAEATVKILPELEYTRRIINERTVPSKNKFNQYKKNLLDVTWNKMNPRFQYTEDYISSETNNLAQMLNDWLQIVVYMQDENMNPTAAKLLNVLRRFTGLKVMGLNLMSMINNTAMAEVNNAVEVGANKYVSAKSYTRAIKEYSEDLPNILGDVGAREMNSKTNLGMLMFGVVNETANTTKMRDRTKAKALSYNSSLYFTTNIGEHQAQGRFLIASLIELRAKDKNGTDIGTMWDNMTVASVENVDKNGNKTITYELRVNANVANFDRDARMAHSRKITSMLREMHGNYSDMTRVALQANALGSLALMFRKWIVPGVERRYRGMFSGKRMLIDAEEQYDQFSGEWRVGYYTRGGKYMYEFARHQLARFKVLQFFGKLIDENKALEYEIAANWNSMTTTEQQAVKRMMTDLAIITALSLIIWGIDAVGDDDDERSGKSSREKKFLLHHFDYQVYRLKTEQAFFFSPSDFMQIFRSPIPALNTLTDWGKLLEQMVTPWEVYETGPSAGQNKLKRITMKQFPVIRQVIRALEPDQQRRALEFNR